MSHYDYLLEHFTDFLAAAEVENAEYCDGLISAHGDKCYGYRYKWEQAGVPFEHGVAIYLLTYVRPYGHEVRETEDGWVDVGQWVISNYDRFKHLLP